MSQTIRVGICGYGNLGKGVEAAIKQNPDMELVAVFTRRKPVETLKINTDVPVVHVDQAADWQDKIDVMVLCGGSANDLPIQGPAFAQWFNTVDSFDTHANIPQHLKAVDQAARASGHSAIVSIGWDPGLFSLMRLYMGAVLPEGKTYTFWGEGVSQGHSDAIRGIAGVENAIQYTVPNQSAIARIRTGETPALTVRQKHTRVCYVAAAPDADRDRIEQEIKQMPNYFDEYDTTVHFISKEELQTNHNKLPHGGTVIHRGKTGSGQGHNMEFSLSLASNPEFTASVLVAYTRAAYRLSRKGEHGARTIFDIPPILLSAQENEQAIQIL